MLDGTKKGYKCAIKKSYADLMESPEVGMTAQQIPQFARERMRENTKQEYVDSQPWML
jgi:hypothetical protein